MDDLNQMVYSLLIQASNLTKLVHSGLQNISFEDLWFTCPECKDVQHSEAMVLLGVSVSTIGVIKPDAAVQSVQDFFIIEDGAVRGLAPGLLTDGEMAAIAFRCIPCASAVWDFELSIPEGNNEEGTTVQ